MRKLNCDAANKLVRRLQQERESILQREREMSSYSYLSGEDPVVPDYNFEETDIELSALTSQIAKLKHAINTFNVSTELPEIGMTVDAALVTMSVLNGDKSRFDRMRNAQSKSRHTVMGRGVSEYTELNYDRQVAQKRYDEVCSQLLAIQQAIDMANLTRTVEVDI